MTYARSPTCFTDHGLHNGSAGDGNDCVRDSRVAASGSVATTLSFLISISLGISTGNQSRIPLERRVRPATNRLCNHWGVNRYQYSMRWFCAV
jgi:hypothetical protein